MGTHLTSCLAVFAWGAAGGGGCAWTKDFKVGIKVIIYTLYISKKHPEQNKSFMIKQQTNNIHIKSSPTVVKMLSPDLNVSIVNNNRKSNTYHWRRWLRDSRWRRCQLRWRRRRRESGQPWRTRPGWIRVSNFQDWEGQKRTWYLGKPRIDWNSDVEPRDKPPNISWPPARLWSHGKGHQNILPASLGYSAWQHTSVGTLKKRWTLTWGRWEQAGEWII